MSRQFRFLISASFVLLAIASAAQAIPLTFTFTGTGTGTAGNTAFTDRRIRIDVFADTVHNYSFISSEGHRIVRTGASPGTIGIDGIGQGAFRISRHIFCNQGHSGVGVTGAPQGDLLDINDPVFAPYELDRPFGPVFEAYPSAVYQFKNVETDLGLVSFTSIRNVTFVVTPDPATLCLLFGGVGVLLARRPVPPAASHV